MPGMNIDGLVAKILGIVDRHRIREGVYSRYLWQALHIKFCHILKSETRKPSAKSRTAVDYYIIAGMIYLPLAAYQFCRGMTRNYVYAVIVKILLFIVGTNIKQFIKRVLGYLLAFSEISQSCVHKNESLISYVYCFISVKAVNEVNYFLSFNRR